MSLQHGIARFALALAGGVSLVALAHVQPAAAQQAAQSDQPAASSENGLEEIVVTARRKEEKAQTVPVTVQTYSTQFVQENEINSVHEVAIFTPQLNSIGGPGKDANTWLRGIIGAVQYFDEVPGLANAFSGFALYFDIANVQVLKGPQGTLFGQSADAGVILITPNPTKNDFEGTVMAEVGDYGHKHLEGVLNIPVIDDKLVVRVGALTNHLDGYVLDLVTNQETGMQEYQVYRATVTARPTDDFQNNFVINYFHTTSLPQEVLDWYVNPPGGLGATQAASYGAPAIPISYLQARLGWYAADQGNYRGSEFSSEQDFHMIDIATLDVSDNLTLKNILGASIFEPGKSQVGSTVPGTNFFPLSAATVALMNADPLVVPAVTTIYTEELQLQGRALDDKLGYTIGTFDDFVGTRQNPYGPTYTPVYNLTGGAVNGSESWGTQRTNALYATGTYDLAALADGLKLTVGGRYTWDKQYLDTFAFTGAKVIQTQVSQLGHYHAFSYNASLDYQVSPSTLVYASDAKGYSKGGFNTGNAAFIPQFASYNPESLDNFEIGIKSDWSYDDIKFRTNLEAYYSFYDNDAVLIASVLPSPFPGQPPGSTSLTENAAQGHIEGVEGEFTIVPTDDLTFSGVFGYMRFKFDTFINFAVPSYGTDWSDINQFYAPQLQYNLRATYKLPVLEWVAPGQDLGTMSLTTVYAWTAHVYGTEYIANTVLNSPHAWDEWDLNLNWRDMMGREGLNGRVYVTNLGDSHNYVDSGSLYFNGGDVGRVSHVPRMWGVSVTDNF